MSFEKVNPSHPDKIADRIAGAIVDLAYKKQDNPRIAVEILIGHRECHIIAETSVGFTIDQIESIVYRITGEDANNIYVGYTEEPQDVHLAINQNGKIRCGDNGIFKGVVKNQEEAKLSKAVRRLYELFPSDGKYIYSHADKIFIACQSNATGREILGAIDGLDYIDHRNGLIINPIGEWTGGTNVDTGATNRKLGSDMGRAVTGGGLHGKDLSKADVSVNIACRILALESATTVDALCAIGDEQVTFKMHRSGLKTTTRTIDYATVVEMARKYVQNLGGFEKLAEWGLI